ncbi:MAG: SH3 domain-containing protein [Synergistaceae bacterium]|jgi:hypothetical protein|nr:SH3 domain-containing protein [Synergistaceae bacterium]
MRRGPVRKTTRGVFQARYIIPLMFLMVGVIVAYGLLFRDAEQEQRYEPVIVRPSDMPPITPEEPSMTTVLAVDGDNGENFVVGPMDANNVVTPLDDQFSDVKKRVAAYKVNSSALRKTVGQYSSARENQCAGEITVQTDDTPLNVRSGPSTGSPVLSKAAKGSKYTVLLWAPDNKMQSGRWFLLADDKKKTVLGWVAGDYCETSGVVFP